MWCFTPVVKALGSLRQEDCCELQVNLGYIVDSRLTWATLSFKKEKKKERKQDTEKEKEGRFPEPNQYQIQKAEGLNEEGLVTSHSWSLPRVSC